MMIVQIVHLKSLCMHYDSSINLLTKSTALRHCISILLRHCVLCHFVSVLSQNYSKMAVPEKIGKSHDCVPRLLDSGKGKT